MTQLRWFVPLLAFGLFASSFEVGAKPAAAGYDTHVVAVDICPPPDDFRDHDPAAPLQPGCLEPCVYQAEAASEVRPAPVAGVVFSYQIRAPPPPLQ